MFRTDTPQRPYAASTCFHVLFVLLAFCCTAMPAFAADPKKADPDPDEIVSIISREIVLRDLAELDEARLAPGAYTVWIVDDAGNPKAVYEIFVQPRD